MERFVWPLILASSQTISQQFTTLEYLTLFLSISRHDAH
jgi:hypothetical protein